MHSLRTQAESTQRLSDALKDRASRIPCREIAGFRNVPTHSYLAVDAEVVWSVVEQDLPKLAPAILRLRSQLDGGMTT